MTSSFGFGNYAAGSVKLEKRFSHGLQFLTSYVWSHALANSGTPLSGSSNLAPHTNTNYATGYSSASLGYPPQLDHRVQLRTAVRQRQAVRRQYQPFCGRASRWLADQWHSDACAPGVPITMAGANCHGVWNRCMPDYAAGLHRQRQQRASRRPHAQRVVQHQRLRGGLPNQAAGIATGGDVGLQIITGPPPRPWISRSSSSSA